jgi:hypothetical protein
MTQQSKDEAGRDVAADPAECSKRPRTETSPRPISEADADSPSAIPVYPPVQGDGS